MDLPVEDQPPLSLGRRLGKIAFLQFGVGVLVGGYWIWKAWNQPFFLAPDEEPPELGRLIFVAVAMFVLATVMLIVAAAFYALVRMTNGFTMRSDVPGWLAANKRLSWIDMLMQLLGFAALLGYSAAIFLPTLEAARVTFDWAFVVLMIAATVPAMWFSILVDPWAPVQRNIATKRVNAIGVEVPPDAQAFYIGISEPAEEKAAKGRYRERDIGVLIVTDDRLKYVGDARSFDIARDQVTSIVRVPNSKDSSSLVGGRIILMQWLDEAGRPQAVNIYANGGIATVFGITRALNQLGDILQAWHRRSEASPVQQGSFAASPLVS